MYYMREIIVSRTPHIELNPIYRYISLGVLGVSILLFITLTVIALIIQHRNWLDDKLDKRLIINIFALGFAIIVAVTLWNIKDYDKIQEKVAYKGEVKDIGSNYVILKDRDDDRIFYDEELKNQSNIQSNQSLKHRFNVKKGDTVKVNTVIDYDSKSEIGTRNSFTPDDTYKIKTITKAND